MGYQRHAPASLPPVMTRYPLYRRLCGLQGRPGRMWNISPSTGILSLDLPTRSESLYRLSYPGPYAMDNKYNLIEVLISQAVRCLYMCLQVHPLPFLSRSLSMLFPFTAVIDCDFSGCLWSKPGQILFSHILSHSLFTIPTIPGNRLLFLCVLDRTSS